MGGLFSKPSIPAPPPIPPTPTMPDQSSPAVLEAQRQQATADQARSGRRSTILTKPLQEPITAPYTSPTLGSSPGR